MNKRQGRNGRAPRRPTIDPQRSHRPGTGRADAGQRGQRPRCRDRPAVTKMAGLSYTLRKTARLIITGVLDEAVTAGKTAKAAGAPTSRSSAAAKKRATQSSLPRARPARDARGGVRTPHDLADGRVSAEIREAWQSRNHASATAASAAGIRAGKAEPHGDDAAEAREAGSPRRTVPGYVGRCQDLRTATCSATASRFPLYSACLKASRATLRLRRSPTGSPPRACATRSCRPVRARRAEHRCRAVARAPGYQRDVPHLGRLMPSAAARAVSVLDAEYAEWSAAA